MSRRIAAAAIVAFTLAAEPAFADFNRLAGGLRTLGFERTWIPFLGIARSLVRVVHPKGVHDFQIAVYEKAPRVSGNVIEKMIRTRMGAGFTPLVRTYSARKGESVFIYARPGRDSRTVELIVLSHERNETVLVRVTADASIVGRELNAPQRLRFVASR